MKELRSQCIFMCAFSACIGAQDPYCGWDAVMKKCTSLEESLSMTQWDQSIPTCPVCAHPLQIQKYCPREADLHSLPFKVDPLLQTQNKFVYLHLIYSWLVGGSHKPLQSL